MTNNNPLNKPIKLCLRRQNAPGRGSTWECEDRTIEETSPHEKMASTSDKSPPKKKTKISDKGAFRIPDDQLESVIARIFSDDPDGKSFAKKCAGQIIRHHQQKRLAQKQGEIVHKSSCTKLPDIPETPNENLNSSVNVVNTEKDISPSYNSAESPSCSSQFSYDVDFCARSQKGSRISRCYNGTPYIPESQALHLSAVSPTSGCFSDAFGVGPISPKEEARIPDPQGTVESIMNLEYLGLSPKVAPQHKASSNPPLSHLEESEFASASRKRRANGAGVDPAVPKAKQQKQSRNGGIILLQGVPLWGPSWRTKSQKKSQNS